MDDAVILSTHNNFEDLLNLFKVSIKSRKKISLTGVRFLEITLLIWVSHLC